MGQVEENVARLAKEWAAEAAGRARAADPPENVWTAFVRRMPVPHVEDELTVFFYDVVSEARSTRPLVEVPGSAGVAEWSGEHFSRLLKRVMRTVQLVASPWEIQKASMPEFVSVPTEVYEEFSECRGWVDEGGHLHRMLRHDQETAIRDVQRALASATEHHGLSLFQHEAPKNLEGWRWARESAAAALEQLGIGSPNGG